MSKIIDEKGRLFGKINLFDLTVILLIIFCGVAVYVGIRYPGRISRIIKGEPELKPVLVRVVLAEDLEWLSEYISIGDFQKGRFGEIIAEIIEKKWVSFVNGGRRLVIDLKVNARLQPGGILTIGGKPLRTGYTFGFGSKKVNFRGYVLEVTDFKRE